MADRSYGGFYNRVRQATDWDATKADTQTIMSRFLDDQEPSQRQIQALNAEKREYDRKKFNQRMPQGQPQLRARDVSRGVRDDVTRVRVDGRDQDLPISKVRGLSRGDDGVEAVTTDGDRFELEADRSD